MEKKDINGIGGPGQRVGRSAKRAGLNLAAVVIVGRNTGPDFWEIRGPGIDRLGVAP